MITDLQLYEVIKTCLPNDIKTRFNFIKTIESKGLELKIIPNTITIQLFPAEKPLRDLKGNYYRFSKRVVFNIFTDNGTTNSRESIDRGLKYIDEIKGNLNKLHNCIVDIVDNENIVRIPIIDCQLTIDGYHVGKTEQGINYFSLEYKIIYWGDLNE